MEEDKIRDGKFYRRHKEGNSEAQGRKGSIGEVYTR